MSCAIRRHEVTDSGLKSSACAIIMCWIAKDELTLRPGGEHLVTGAPTAKALYKYMSNVLYISGFKIILVQ